MVGYSAYEASCVLREGCYGPASQVALQPAGLSTTMVPVGILVAAAAIQHLGRRGGPAPVTVLAALAVVATVRATASFWLPKIGGGLTRQHWTSSPSPPPPSPHWRRWRWSEDNARPG